MGWFSEEVQARQGKDGRIPKNRMVVTTLPIRVYNWQDIEAAIGWYEALDKKPEEPSFVTELHLELAADCQPCIHRHECNLSPDYCGGPYTETQH